MAIDDLKKNATDPVTVTIGSRRAPKPTVGPNGVKPVIQKPANTVSTPTPKANERVTLDLTNIRLKG